VKEFLRGAVRLHVLFHAANGAVYGAWLSEELARHGYRISPGSLYPALHAMEAEGLLDSDREVVDSRVRRVYRSTPKGLKVLEEAKGELRELAREVLGGELG
jgi:DNA-binding PadR family transcriptional regulator